jgi:hypothetical protein
MILKFMRLPRVPHFFSMIFGFLLLINCQQLLAAQPALVIHERALVYADSIMTSPVGYLSKGKKIRVSDRSKNKGQVYALVIAGRIAYISSQDISTEVGSVGSKNLTAERFKLITEEKYQRRYSLFGFMYPSQINSINSNGGLQSGDRVSWSGLSLKGTSETKYGLNLEFLINYLIASSEIENFKSLEFGIGTSWTFVKFKKFEASFYTHGLIIPFASYEVENKFRKNSFGLGFGAGFNLNYILTQNLGIETFSGVYLNRIIGFDSPAPYNKFTPSFLGPRIGLGINYHF